MTATPGVVCQVAPGRCHRSDGGAVVVAAAAADTSIVACQPLASIGRPSRRTTLQSRSAWSELPDTPVSGAGAVAEVGSAGGTAQAAQATSDGEEDGAHARVDRRRRASGAA